MVWQIGPAGSDPTPLSERPLDVLCFSKPVFRIVRAPTTGWAKLPETFRQMPPNSILLVKSRHGKPQPQVDAAAKKAKVKIEIQSRPFQDDILVTVLGPMSKDKETKAPRPAAEPKEPAPRARFFRSWKQPSANVDIFS